MAYTVYMHTTPSGKRYVGVTKKEPNRRWESGSGYKTQMFGRAVNKYGWDNIHHEILLTGLTKEEAEEREQFFIALFRTRNRCFGYNCESGGNLGKELSEDTRRKLSVAASGERHPFWGKHLTEEHRRNISLGNKGKKLSEEHRAKLRDIAKTRTYSKTTRLKLSEATRGENNPFYGKRHTAESRKKISEANKGRSYSEAERAKRSEAVKGAKNPHFGKPVSEDRRKEISDRNSRSVINVDTGEIFKSGRAAAAHYNIPATCVSGCVRGKQKTAGGYHWAYYTENVP